MISPLLLALVAIAPVSASRLAVAPLRGKGGDVCANELSALFSSRATIVPLDASIEGLTNWDELAEWIEKNGAVGADIVVLGSINNSSLVLEAYTTHDKRLVGLKSIETKGRCKIAAEEKNVLIQWLDSVLPTESSTAPPVGKDAPPTEKQKVELETDTPAYGIAIRGSVAIGRRGLSFEGVSTANIRAYEVDVMPVPSLWLEAYPFAGTDVWEYVRPLGLSASFARSLGLTSARIDGGPELDTTHTEFSAALLYRWHVPLDSLRFDLIPQIGYHHLAFGLRNEGGASEPDLPDVSYSSVSFGIGADVPVLDHVNVFGSGAYLLVLDAGQIFGAGFFDEGKARGYQIQIGMGYEVVHGLTIEIAGHHTSYQLTLNARPTDRRIAESAADTLSGIGLGLRVEL